MQQARRLIALASDLGSAELVDPLSRVNNSFAHLAMAHLPVLSSTVLKDRLLWLSKPGPVDSWF